MIWLDGNVPSLKNSKIKTSRGIFPSKTVMKYLRFLGIKKYSVTRKEVHGYTRRDNLFENLRPQIEKATKGLEYPYKVGIHFVRDSKRNFDFHNAVQIIADLMVAHDFIEDDDMNHFIPVPFKLNGQYFSYNKEKPGVFIKLYKT